ncbi:hypothetical protein WI92_15440 [Burkholderia vietnamiensis]|nr:hypothetical protein WI92_15440 [Burkholderia vietnamiensis]
MARDTLPRYQEHFASGNFYYLNEDDRRTYTGVAWRTMENLGWEDEQVMTLIAALDADVHWQKEVPMCKVCHPKGTEYVTADQYFIIWDDAECTWKDDVEAGCVALSLKLAIVFDENGEAAGLVTMHPSGTK